MESEALTESLPITAVRTVIYNLMNLPPQVYIDCSGDMLITSQDEIRDCDINYIVRTFGSETAYKDPSIVTNRMPVYGDFSHDLHGDYMYAQNFQLYANELFMSLPSEMRFEYSNDPGLFLQDYEKNPESFERFFKVETASSTVPPPEGGTEGGGTP